MEEGSVNYMRKRTLGLFVLGLAVLILILLCGTAKYWLGVSKDNIESSAREFQGVSEDWKVTQETTNTISAMLFYSDDRANFSYSIYLNKPGFSFGYFFRTGGTISEIENGIVAISFEGYSDIVYLSMNKAEVNSILVDDGSEIKTIETDITVPFVVILPNNAGNVTFLDVDGNTVDFVRREFPE